MMRQSQIMKPKAMLGLRRERRRTVLFPVLISILLLGSLLIPAAAMRLGLETADTDVYLQEYATYDVTSGLLGGPFEPAFMLLSWIGKSLGANAGQYLWIVASIGVLLKLLGIYRSSNFFGLAILVYLSKYFLLHEMTQMRAGIATAIFLCSLPFLHRREGWRYVLCIVLACAFHQSAILYILLYPVCKVTKRKILPLFLLIAGGVLFALLNASGMLIGLAAGYVPKIESYLELLAAGEHAEIHLFNAEIIVKIVVWLILLSRYERLSDRYFLFDTIFKIWTLSIVFYFALSSVPVFAFRVSELLDVVTIPLLPALVVAFDITLVGLGVFTAVITFLFANYYFIQPIFL